MARRDLEEDDALSTGVTETELDGNALDDGGFAWATPEEERYVGGTYVPEIDGDLDEDVEVHVALSG